MTSTGVVLFVYNRPRHTERVLAGLQQNSIDELYIFADGPKPTDDIDEIMEVRNLIDDIGWCKTHITTRDENWGLAETTLDGVNEVFRHHERIIVLEDDDVPNPNFIEFMENFLQRYENHPRVMNITG